MTAVPYPSLTGTTGARDGRTGWGKADHGTAAAQTHGQDGRRTGRHPRHPRPGSGHHRLFRPRRRRGGRPQRRGRSGRPADRRRRHPARRGHLQGQYGHGDGHRRHPGHHPRQGRLRLRPPARPAHRRPPRRPGRRRRAPAHHRTPGTRRPVHEEPRGRGAGRQMGTGGDGHPLRRQPRHRRRHRPLHGGRGAARHPGGRLRRPHRGRRHPRAALPGHRGPDPRGPARPGRRTAVAGRGGERVRHGRGALRRLSGRPGPAAQAAPALQLRQRPAEDTGGGRLDHPAVRLRRPRRGRPAARAGHLRGPDRAGRRSRRGLNPADFPPRTSPRRPLASSPSVPCAVGKRLPTLGVR
ncbi:hypothetical protein SGPA1_60039 [Streptomyces misionensis JCM 4497]